MKYSEDIKLEIGGKFLNGDYHKDLKQLTKDLDRLIKSAKSEQLKLYDVVGRSEQLPPFYCPNCGNEWDTNKNNACQCGAYVRR